MLRIAMLGATGRMGRAIIHAMQSRADMQLAGTMSRNGNLSTALSTAQVAIDFSTPAASITHAIACGERGLPLVIGTTGFSAAQEKSLRETAVKIPLLVSPNMSVGVNIFWHLAQQCAALMGADYRIAIEETHHVHKKDAPSGTAKHLHALVAAAAKRDPSAIPVVSHRRDEVVGDHEIIFTGPGDSLRITHHATDRAIFATGALTAAQWLASQTPGWYGMNDVLFNSVASHQSPVAGYNSVK